MSAQDYDFRLAVGGTQEINSEGRFLYYLSGSAGGLSERIKVKHQASGLQMKLMPGQAFELPAGAKLGASWRIENADGQAVIVGSVIVGRGAFKDNRMSGSVSVVEGGKVRTSSGGAFSGYLGQSAVAGKYAHVQIWNPAGSKKNIFVESMIFVVSASPSFVVVAHDSGQLTAQWASTSKKVGGALSAGVLCKGSLASVAIGEALAGMTIQQNVPQVLNFREPLMVPEGRGVVVASQVLASDLQVSFESFEEPV